MTLKSQINKEIFYTNSAVFTVLFNTILIC